MGHSMLQDIVTSMAEITAVQLKVDGHRGPPLFNSASPGNYISEMVK